MSSAPRTIVVTGTSSFVGAHLADAFARTGHRVTATHSRPRAGYDGVRADRLAHAEAGGAILTELDITDGGAVRALVDRFAPDIWIHHAGHAVDYASLSYDQALGDSVNVAPLDAIFRALAGSRGGVIVTGSSAEYAASDRANREDETEAPEMPYGRSKKSETERARELSAATGVPCRVGRLYIPFGRLDHPGKLLAQAMDGLAAGQHIDLSPCTQRRDFIGVGDVCTGWAAMAGDLARGGFDIFNICSGGATELKTLLVEIANAMDADTALLRFGARGMRPGEAPVSFGNNSKANALLNWSPRPLAQALREDLLPGAVRIAEARS
ncbi:MAG: hypothetical protein CMM61_07345 [Rhodospirillaceae bacterium]|nr:hypothetical protein [Rhodospirillaceae bacterium]